MKLNVIEIFPSIQGETSLTGLPTSFIRLAACNLRCSWCDTAYSFGKGTPWELSQILAEVEKNGCPYVCVTGGEPLLQKNVHPLMKKLSDLGYVVSLETGGSLSIADVDPRTKIILDIKCPGSNMESKNEWNNLSLLICDKDEVKFVLTDRNDYTYAKEICKKYDLFNRGIDVLFSPAFGLLDPKLLVQWILSDKLKVRLNLQVHKYVWSPEMRGV